MQFSPGRQRSRQTSCSVCWMQRLAWSPVQESVTAAWLRFFTLSSIGLTCLNVSSISHALCSSCFSGLQATSVFCRSSSVGGTVLPPQYVRSSGCCCRWPYDVECISDTATSSGCRSLLLLLDDFWRLLCSRSTDVLSALEAFAMKRYTNRHFTLHYIVCT